MSKRYRVKPSKNQSVLAMVIGIGFVIIGLTQVNNFGAFGVIWILVALGITIYHGANVFSENGVSTYQIDVQDNRLPQSADAGDFESKLRQLHRLREDNIINEEEYERKKEELLNSKW